MPLAGPGTFDAFFGDGSDGDTVFTNGGQIIGPMSYGTVTVNGLFGLELNGNPLFCHRLIVDASSSNLFQDGAVHCNGGHAGVNTNVIGKGAQAGFFGGGGDGGLGGIGAAPVGTDAQDGLSPPGQSIGARGGDGGIGLSGRTGLGALPTMVPARYLKMANFITALCGGFLAPGGLVFPSGGGGGGGGGRLDGTQIANGGAGGGGGGICFVCAREIILTGNFPHFGARGGNGGNGGGTRGTGGGGGGGGGAIILVYSKIVGNLLTTVLGGVGGIAPQQTQNGKPGSPGRFFPYLI